MALTPEELQILQRIEKQLKDMPFYVVEYIRSKKRAGLSADTLLQYLYRYQHFSNGCSVKAYQKLPIRHLSPLPFWRN